MRKYCYDVITLSRYCYDVITLSLVLLCTAMTSSHYHWYCYDVITSSLKDRVNDAVGRMTLAEKVGNLDTGANAIPSLGLSAYNWWSEASTGVASGRNTQTTKFAFPITTGMSFNRTLWQLTGRQIGREARAMMNAGNGYSTFWAPVINLAREVRCSGACLLSLFIFRLKSTAPLSFALFSFFFSRLG